jgi:ribonuclease D
MCGYGESVSYENLVNKIVGAELDKGSRYTDWAARPLSTRQLEYALCDVTYLRKIYEHLRADLESKGRTDWVSEEQAYLAEPSLYKTEPADAWKRLRYGTMRPKNLAILRELASWREQEARKCDVPRGRVLKDEALLELAVAMPKKPADLARMRSFDKSVSKTRIDEIFAIIERASQIPPSEYPQISKGSRSSENIVGALAMLQLLLKVNADSSGIAAPIIAGKDELEEIALGNNPLSGWRMDIFGNDADLLVAGKLKLSLNPENKQVIFWQD